MRARTCIQQPPPLLVGERVNSQGSRKVKRLLLADDYDSILDVAREQVDGGAHVLDVCVALTERADEATQMVEVVKRLRAGVDAPLMIDTHRAGRGQGRARGRTQAARSSTRSTWRPGEPRPTSCCGWPRRTARRWWR